MELLLPQVGAGMIGSVAGRGGLPHCALKEAQLALRLCSLDAICIKLMSSSTDKQHKQTEGATETQRRDGGEGEGQTWTALKTLWKVNKSNGREGGGVGGGNTLNHLSN